jgi:hypothetical protein
MLGTVLLGKDRIRQELITDSAGGALFVGSLYDADLNAQCTLFSGRNKKLFCLPLDTRTQYGPAVFSDAQCTKPLHDEPLSAQCPPAAGKALVAIDGVGVYAFVGPIPAPTTVYLKSSTCQGTPAATGRQYYSLGDNIEATFPELALVTD